MDNKEAIRLKLKSQLEEWEADFNKLIARNKGGELEADFNKLKAETKGAFAEGTLEGSEEGKALQSKIKEAKEKLKRLENAGEEKWQALKSEIENNWKGIKDSIDALQKKI